MHESETKLGSTYWLEELDPLHMKEIEISLAYPGILMEVKLNAGSLTRDALLN